MKKYLVCTKVEIEANQSYYLSIKAYVNDYNERGYTQINITKNELKSVGAMSRTNAIRQAEKWLNTEKGIEWLTLNYLRLVDTNPNKEETPEQTETKELNINESPEQKFMNDKKITNVEFLELLDKYDIEISYSLLNWTKEKLDAVGLGQYTYRASFKGSFPNELSNIVDQLYDAIKEGETASQSHNETIIENMLNHFNELSTSNTLEVFGQITLKIQSWFKLVKYDNKVHAVITLGNEKLELFDEFEKVKNDCIEWLNERINSTPASENVTPNTDNEYDLIIMNQSNNHGYLILNGMYKGKSVTIEQDSSVNLLEIYGDITEHEEDTINDLYINNRFIIHKDCKTA